MTGEKCKHHWIKDGYGDNARERYYCAKCLKVIDVERWKDKIDVYTISKSAFNKPK